MKLPLSQAITIDMDVCVSMTVGPSKKRYCNDFFMDEMVDWAEREVEQHDKGKDATEGVEAMTSTSNKGKKKVSQDATECVEARTSTVDNDYDSEFDNDDDSDYHSEKLVDYILVLFKECLTYYALENGFSLWYARSSGMRVVAKFGQRPPRLSVPEKGNKEISVGISTLAHWSTMKWIAKVFGDKIRANLDVRLCDITDLVMKKYKCKVTPNQCTNAKKYALTEYEKTVGEHYAMLRSYGKAILDSNPGSTVKLGVTVNLDDKIYFGRFYVCFAGLANG
nr:pentatricopeptide repeat-containing protein [Tanacetum cinerariifolium]